MTVLHDPATGRYIWQGRFTERHAPKTSGFRWDPEARIWWTDSPEVAARIPVGRAKAPFRDAGPPSSTPPTPDPAQPVFSPWRELPRRPVCPYATPPGTVEAWPVRERLTVRLPGGTVEAQPGDWIGADGDGKLFVVKRK